MRMWGNGNSIYVGRSMKYYYSFGTDLVVSIKIEIYIYKYKYIYIYPLAK